MFGRAKDKDLTLNLIKSKFNAVKISVFSQILIAFDGIWLMVPDGYFKMILGPCQELCKEETVSRTQATHKCQLLVQSIFLAGRDSELETTSRSC